MKATVENLSKILKIPKSRSQEALIKAKLIDDILRELGKSKITHIELAKRTNIPRSAITGILSGSLQKVTLDRLLRIVEALGFVAELKLRKIRS